MGQTCGIDPDRKKDFGSRTPTGTTRPNQSQEKPQEKGQKMKQGQKVSFYVERNGYRPIIRRGTGIVISFDDFQVYVLPDGKTKAILLPREQVREEI